VNLLDGILIVVSSLLYFLHILSGIKKKLKSTLNDQNTANTDMSVSKIVKAAFYKYSGAWYICLVALKLLYVLVTLNNLAESPMFPNDMSIVQYLHSWVTSTTLYLIIHTTLIASVDAFSTFGEIEKKEVPGRAKLKKKQTKTKMLLSDTKGNNKNKGENGKILSTTDKTFFQRKTFYIKSQ
jgi:hypothetical protein